MPERIQLRRTKGQATCRACGASPARQGLRGFCSGRCRFWSKVRKTDYCWIWEGAPHSSKGYGHFDDGGSRWLAHRYAYTLLVGPIPPGHELDHAECGNTACVRPDHLEPVTPEEHARRTDQGAYQRLKTHCPAGHSYTPTNTRMHRTSRHCRACDSPGWGLKGTRNGLSKLTEATVAEARASRASGARVTDLAVRYQVAQSVMSRALAGVTWSHVA